MVHRERSRAGDCERCLHSVCAPIPRRAAWRQHHWAYLRKHWICIHAFCRPAWTAQEVPDLANRTRADMDARTSLVRASQLSVDPDARGLPFRWDADASFDVALYLRLC